MIGSLRGILISKSPIEIIVDVQGVGYTVSIPLSTFEKIGDVNKPVTLFTHLHVREDALQLFGFATIEERNVFKMLIGVSGIGPKMAQGILSGVTVSDLQNHISRGDLAALTAIPGVGRKIAERLILELREKMTKVETVWATASTAGDPQARARSEALLALTSLGYNRTAAEKAVRAAVQESNGEELSIEALIKMALRYVSK